MAWEWTKQDQTFISDRHFLFNLPSYSLCAAFYTFSDLYRLSENYKVLSKDDSWFHLKNYCLISESGLEDKDLEMDLPFHACQIGMEWSPPLKRSGGSLGDCDLGKRAALSPPLIEWINLHHPLNM